MANDYLGLTLIPAARERRDNHRLKDTAGIGVTWAHKFLVANTSIAGVRSPLQLMRRGAFSSDKAKPSDEYRTRMRGVAWFTSTTGP